MSEQIDKAIAWGCARCAHISETPKLDAELLLAHCLGKPRSYLYSWPEQQLTSDDWRQFQALIASRQEPTPIAYLLGERECFSRTLITAPTALVPRPATESLVETTLAICPNQPTVDLLELGTGTGAIAIAIKTHRPAINLFATDISSTCLDLARQNAHLHALKIDWIQSDWFSRIDRQFDMIVSNPPYISASDPALKQGDLPAEPLMALSPGETGLEALELIIAGTPAYLKPGGYLLLEHGFDQQAAVANLMRQQGFINIDCKLDLNGLARVSLGQFGN